MSVTPVPSHPIPGFKVSTPEFTISIQIRDLAKG